LVVGVLMALLTSCVATPYRPSETSDLPRSSRQPGSESIDSAALLAHGADVTGVWEGISIAGCRGLGISNPGRCAAMQKITLTMFQHGAQVTGYYRCAYGNQNCRDLNEHGIIRNGSMKGRRLMMRVMLEDGSMCFFTAIPDGDLLDGGYECLQGAGIVEQGHFRTERSY